MKKRLLFRTFTVLLAAVTLLSSTSAYNLLVYANQEIVSDTLSATETDDSYEPNITVQGGELQLETNAEGDTEGSAISWGTDANGNPADGSEQNPYQISSLEHFLEVNTLVNDTTGSSVANVNNKYFILTTDIDISSLTSADFADKTGTGSAYFVTTDHKNANSQQVYINIDGSYTDAYGQPQRHKITGGESGWNIDIAGHQYFSIFGYLGQNSVVSNIIFENINVNVTNDSPRQISIIANKNDGTIENCSINNCSIKSDLSNDHENPYYVFDLVYFYDGVAGAVADNGGTIRNLDVNNIDITLDGADDYIGGVVGQNRGLVKSTSVSGIRISATSNNYYIGGIAGYNEPDDTSLGIQNCSVDMAGTDGKVNNFTNGGYVGGLVGSNDGYLHDSSVTGTFGSADKTTSVSYNILGFVDAYSAELTYFGGAAGISTGVISAVTVSDVGFFAHASNSIKQAYFGGITSTVESSYSIVNCVASGVFAASDDAKIYAGGIIGYAKDNIADAAIDRTFALYKIINPGQEYVGAVIGWGGNSSTLSDCYWSDQLSGCAVSYVQHDEFYSDLVANAEAINGNLYSSNRAVIAPKNSNVTVSASSLTHSWDGSGVNIGIPAYDVTVPTNGLANSLAAAPYTVKFTFPAGVGSSDKNEMEVSFNIDVLVTIAQGDPDDINNPMQISSSAQAKYISLVPYGHYILTDNVSVSTYSWDAPVFTGTLNGNGYTITTDGSIFSAVVGARKGDIGSALDTSTYSTNPAADNQNYLTKGYIYDLNADLSEDITKSVFGIIINSTFVNVSLTDGDIATDDGDDDTFDGFYATISDKREAAFAAAANGFSYIYGCSSSVSVNVVNNSKGTANNDIAMFIAKLSGSVTVDNCYVNGNMYIKGGNDGNFGRAVFLGNISENEGYILNSAICTWIKFVANGVFGRHCAVVFGQMDHVKNLNKYKNIVWSKNFGSDNAANVNEPFYPVGKINGGTDYDNTQIILWGATGETYPEKTVAAGNSAGFDISIPDNIKSFDVVYASDFAVSVNKGSESPLEITGVTVEDGNLRIVVKAKLVDLEEGEAFPTNLNDWVRIYHQPSGLTAFVKVLVKESGLSFNSEDGYYHIVSESDLRFLVTNFDKADPNGSGTTYREAAYILDADIYMTAPINPIGNSNNPFTGVFTGQVDENGDPLYTIYDLTFNTTSDNMALFGAVDFSGEDKILGTAQTTAQRGISNIAISRATVDSGENAALLVAYAKGPTGSSVYGKVNISNVVISDSVVKSGDVEDVKVGKATAAVIGYAENVHLNINGVRLNEVEVMSRYYPSDAHYFVDGSTAGIGGIAGVIRESRNGNMDESMNVSITDVQINGIVVSGIGDSPYIKANAGGVVGLFYTTYAPTTKKYATLTIGNPSFSGEGYDVTVNDIVVMTYGVGGGVLGASNVRTDINYAYVSGSTSPIGVEPEDIESVTTRIWGKTELYLGGIAGYVGAVVPETNADTHHYPSLENVYGSVNNSKVENADIRAIINSGTTLTRNVTVGGIVGAINGQMNSTTVVSSEVVSSNLEGVVIGGIVGSCIDTFGRERAYGYVNGAVYSNSINIDLCSVKGTQIKTIDGVTPTQEAANISVAYGVGGILGTNRRSLTSYAMHTSVSRCLVDDKTVITNTIKPGSDNMEKTIHSATGGILGSGFENGVEDGELAVEYNEVYASIITENDYSSGTTLPAANVSFFKALTATGGLVGALIGYHWNTNEPENYAVCDLSKVKIQHGVFAGSIKGTDGIGGAVGVISAASAYTDVNAEDIPENLISDIAITGQLESTLETAVYHGGLVVGHMAVKTNGFAASDADDFYVFDVAAGTAVTDAFNRIYFSSFQVDAVNFPVFGYHNATSTTTSVDTPFYTNAKTILNGCYYDVNMEDDNKTKQFADVSDALETFTLPESSYPLLTRPAGVDNAYSVDGQSWYGSNTDIATIVSNQPNSLTVTPKNSGTIKISIDYVGTVGDSTWYREVSLPAGFKFSSAKQAPLDYVELDGQKYYIISNPYDIVLIGKTPGNANQLNSTYMSATYWIANNVTLEESLFVTNGIYDGGIVPIGTTTLPFSGTITSMPAGEYTTASGTTYVSDGSAKTITGIQLASKNESGTALTHIGLFAYAKGAKFENFSLANVKATSTNNSTSATYMGALAALVQNNVTVDNVILSGLDLSGLKYVGGFFGGIVYSSDTTPSTITNSGVVGNTNDTDETGARIYSNVISGKFGAAGIVAHTSRYNTNMSGITVSDANITQYNTTTGNSYYDYGAAGISLAYSGNITANGTKRNRIEGCSITGEVAAGVVTRTYNSTSNTAYSLQTNTTVSTTAPAYRATEVKISGTDVVATTVTGNHTKAPNTMTATYTSAVGGILARVDASGVPHEIIDCTLDSDTYIKAIYGAGGILGCFESGASSTSTTATQHTVEYPVIIDSCTTFATVEITDTSIAAPDAKVYNYSCLGAGAILGYISRTASYAETYIRNCTAGGVVRGKANIGGIIGAIWSSNTVKFFYTMDHHFAENCVVSAKIEVPAAGGGYVSAFDKNLKGVGVVVGHAVYSSYSATEANGKYLHPTSGKSFSDTNYPFYNIYFSDDTYKGDVYVRLYGIPATNSGKEYSLNGYDYYADYIYNINRTTEFTMSNTNNNFAISFGSESYRIQLANPPVESEKYIYKLNGNTLVDKPYTFNTSIFKLNTEVAGSPTYGIESVAGVNHFNATANGSAVVTAGDETSEFKLESITCPDDNVVIIPVSLETGDFSIGLKSKDAVVSYLEFNYSNGTTLCMQLEIENKPEDYWFRPQSGNASVNDLLIFNAANLSYVSSMAADTSNIIQCYDVFWTVSSSETIAAANAALAGKTLADVYSAEFIADLGSYKHPNPAWDNEDQSKRFVSFDTFYGTTAATRGDLLLSELVGKIEATDFSVYGKGSGSALYNRDNPFKGTYEVLAPLGSEDYYKIYGFALHSTYTSETYPEYSGMFNVIGEGARISNITFIDPDIRATRMLGADNYVGVLAGVINGATVSNITVRKSAENATAQVLSLRLVSPAGTYVGAVAGAVGAGTTLTNVTVDGITVAGAAKAGNRATQDKEIKNVFVGGVAGISTGAISGATLDNINVLVNRDEASARGYISYAGSVAGMASGTVSDVSVSAVVSGCNANIESNTEAKYGEYITFTCVANPSAEVGDRLGGVVGLANGTLALSNVNINKLSVNAFDIAGGLIAEVNSDKTTSVTISGCDIGNTDADENRAQITISGSSNITGKTYSREFYNVAGGAVGYVNKVALLHIDDCDFAGYVGQYALEHKNCTAGGIIGLVDADIDSLNSIVIGASTVQGEVAGYRRGANDSAEKRMYGAAGGIIGKIYSFAKKTFNSSDKMISDSVMSAKVNLYDSVNGSTVKADYATLENQNDTYVGKIIGELRNDDSGDNFAYTAGTADDSGILFTNYVNNVYVSSYPQNIVAYGCNTFYTNQNNDPADTYIDINTENRYMASDAEAPENVSSFMVDCSVVDISDPSVQHDYDTGTYSGVAIITFDEDQAATSASRHFRLAYDSLVFKEGKDAIEFNGGFNISVENGSDDLKDVTVSSSDYQSSHRLTESVTLDGGSTHSYNYYTGVITVNSSENVDIVGYISAGYSYGLEVGIQFVSMEIAGNGTQVTPFEVAKPKHFKVVRALRGAFYKQVANIDFADPANNQYNAATDGAMYADIKGIEPIGTSSAPFTGNYNGQGYVISNVYIGRSDENNVGFFGYVGNGNNQAILRNIHIELASELDITDENANVTPVAGGITGKEGVGGLVGYAYNASITNCSVANGFVMGQTRVGGLVGRTGNAHLDSCFTSTSTYSYAAPAYGDGSTKTVGALIGYVGSQTGIGNSFTLGLASVGTTNKIGSAGGMVGYNAGTLTITDSLVGATVSDSSGSSVSDGTVKALTVGGMSATGASVVAGNIIVAPTNALSMRADAGVTDYVNPVVGINNTGSISSVYVDTGVTGVLNGTESYAAVVKTAEGLYNFNVSTAADVAGDAYTAAYVAAAVIPVEVSEKEIADREILSNKGNSGLFYPVTLNHGGDYSFTSSVIDMSDTVAYPDGLDADMYGIRNDGGVNKNTDLLFRDKDGKTTVYANIYPYAIDGKFETGAVLKDGNVHANGEVAYSASMPYFTLSASATVKDSLTVEVTRKVVYPVQYRNEYPIATARQLFALSNSAGAAVGEKKDKYEDYADEIKASKFFDFYTLNGIDTAPETDYTVVADINLGSVNYTPIVGYSGEFDGNGFTLSNLRIDMPDSNEVGLFRTLSSGTVKNLTVGVDTINANNNVGALVGAIIVKDTTNTAINASAKIENCHAVISEGGEGIVATGRNIGGLVGATTRSSADSGITGSSSSVKVSGYDVVGGLVGYSEQPIDNSYSTGEVNVQFTSSSAATQVHPWVINGADDTAASPISTSTEHGVGGVVGVLRKGSSNSNVATASVSYCFGSGIVTVTNAAYASGVPYGVGGLVGINCANTKIETSFSSGNVYYCYGNGSLAPCNGSTVGVGGLVGIMYSGLDSVYSSASVAADFGEVSSATAVGAGGVAGVAYAKLSSAYSSGATLGTTVTPDYSGCNYGAGGVIGILDYTGDPCANLIFDLNLSITDKVVGKILSGSFDEISSGAKTTKYLTAGPEADGGEAFMSLSFGYVKGAYPYLTNFFRNDVSLTIRINALLSIVALQLNDLDVSAANGDGISMALDIPTKVEYKFTGNDDDGNDDDTVIYTYSYSDRNNLVDAAQGVIDEVTNTLSIQRTQNEAQYVNFVISIDTKDGNTSDENGNVYADVATRLVSRLCAPMLGTQTHPYLVATQKDFEHVGMTSAELSAVPSDPAYKMYTQWATPILENGTPTEGVVNFRLMGYVPLTDYNRTVADLTNENYSLVHNGNAHTVAYKGISFDGNGYSIRNLNSRLFAKLDSLSVLRNMTFENVSFADTSLIGEVDGTVEGINVYGTASGSNTAGVANTVNEGGKIIGSVVNLDYNDSSSTSNVAGVALTNNGEIRKSASVGNFSGDAVSGIGGMVVTNTGTIVDSFTIGNMQFDDATNLGGFVNTNGADGSIQNCYTRCNIIISNNPADRVIGGFVAHNNSGAIIKNAYSSGMFKLAADTAPLNIFAAQSEGTLTDCMFDKQMSGSTFSTIYDMAERTLDIVNLTNHSSMIGAYEVKEPTIDASTNTYYPQLFSILKTEAYETQINDKGEEVQVETVDSRMYRVLRAYSFISSATALVGNDNYIDNLALGSSTALSYDSLNNALWIKTSGSDLASVSYARRILAVGELPEGYNPSADNTTVISAIKPVKDFYDLAIEDAQLDLFVEVTGAGHPNFAGGYGTTEAPFEISTPEQFVALSFYGTNADNNFKVINDIDMSSAVWTSYIDNFKADLNGDGKAVYNITIPADGNDSLFGKINGGKIDKLGVAGIDVTADGSSGGMLASSVTGNASITNTYVVGTLKTSTGSDQTNIGGLVGEIDNSTIDGCVVSGKINSDASTTGGVVGSALDGSVIKNVLSTVYVDGGAGTAAGIAGKTEGDSVQIESCIFASDVKGGTKGNIVGDGTAGDSNCYYDNQMSTVIDGADGRTTYYLTGGATTAELFGDNTTMSYIDGFAGYPVPAGMVSGSDNFLAGLKLASAKINLASGAGAGTLSSFTTITAPSDFGKLTFAGGTPAYLVNITDTQINTDTAQLALGAVENRQVIYSLGTGSFDGGKMFRFVDVFVGKTLKVTYVFDNLADDANSVLTAYSGMSNVSAVTSLVTKDKHTDTLCSSMVIPYDADEGAYIIRVGAELPSASAVNTVKADVRKNGVNALATIDGSYIVNNGTYKLAIAGGSEIDCDEIVITINVKDAPWGIHNYFNIF